MSNTKELKWKNEIKIRIYNKQTIDLFNQFRAKRMSEIGVDNNGRTLTSENQIWEQFLLKHLKEELLESNKSIFENEIKDLIDKSNFKRMKYVLKYVDSMVAQLMPYILVSDKKTNYLLNLIADLGKINLNDLNDPHEQKLNDLDVIKKIRNDKITDYDVWVEERDKLRKQREG